MVDERDDLIGASDADLVGGAESGVEDNAKLKAENSRLRQTLAHQEDLNRQALPYVKVARALQTAPGGDAIIKKLEKGEPLTEKQAAKVVEAVDKTGEAVGGVTADEVREMLGEFGQQFHERLQAGRQAEKATSKLDARAIKELEGYEILKGSEDWNTTFPIVMDQIKRGIKGEAGGLVVPDDEDDVYWFAVKRTYKMLQAMNAGEKKPAGQDEKDRLAAMLKGRRKSPASKSQDDDENVPEEIKAIREMGTGVIGKRFSS